MRLALKKASPSLTGGGLPKPKISKYDSNVVHTILLNVIKSNLKLLGRGHYFTYITEIYRCTKFELDWPSSEFRWSPISPLTQHFLTRSYRRGVK